MSDRFGRLMEALRDAVLTTPGATDPPLRRAVAGASAVAAGGRRPEPGTVPAALGPYADKIARHAYRVTDADVAALKAAGYSEDALFEVTTSAAFGAGAARLEQALAAIRGEV